MFSTTSAPVDIDGIAIIGGMEVREAHELHLAAEAAGLAVRQLRFGSACADAALAAQGPGAVRLPLVVVADRYTLQRPSFSAVVECIEVLRGTRQTLPAGCVAIAPTPAPAARASPKDEPST